MALVSLPPPMSLPLISGCHHRNLVLCLESTKPIPASGFCLWFESAGNGQPTFFRAVAGNPWRGLLWPLPPSAFSRTMTTGACHCLQTLCLLPHQDSALSSLLSGKGRRYRDRCEQGWGYLGMRSTFPITSFITRHRELVWALASPQSHVANKSGSCECNLKPKDMSFHHANKDGLRPPVLVLQFPGLFLL